MLSIHREGPSKETCIKPLECRWCNCSECFKRRKTRLGDFPHFCTSLIWGRPTAIGQLRRQSPLYHQRLMKQITVGAFAASQRAVERGDVGGVGESVFVYVYVCVGGWGGIQGWLDSLQSAVRNRQETFNQLVCIRQDGTIAPARHKAGQRHRSQMLSPSLQWHANSIFIKVGSLFALSGLIHGRDFYLLVGDRFCMCVKFC